MSPVNSRRRARAVAVAVVLALSLACDSHAGAAASDPAMVRVESGTLAGKTSDGVSAFLGIPYAAPPTGDRRWEPPAAPISWAGTRNADDYGPSCLQGAPPGRVPFGSRGQSMSEDCLTLNVWTPIAHTNPLPVMVFLHGGGNVGGTGADYYYNGAPFARDGIVLVTLNYRLGAFGIFAHSAIMREAGNDCGNFGLLDQIAALRWVRSNIAAFGGDPSNVTLFGESAGALDTVILAASPAADGLFEKAIAESAAEIWGDWLSPAQAQDASSEIARKLGLSGGEATAAQLRALPADALAQVSPDDDLDIIIDGHVVPARMTLDSLRRIHVPIIIGTNAGDGVLGTGLTHPEKVSPRLSKDDLAFFRERYASLGITGDAALAPRLYGDILYTAPARWLAENVAAEKRPVYLYRFDYILSALANTRRIAPHGSEIPFVFANYPPIVDDADRSVGAALHGCWAAFARTGTPQCPAAPVWPVYDAANGREMVFGNDPSLRAPDDDDVLRRLEERLRASP